MRPGAGGFGVAVSSATLGMADDVKLRAGYVLAKCCRPGATDRITGYFSHHNFLKVHRSDCRAITAADAQRLVPLVWADILTEEDVLPGPDYDLLDATDFAVLGHHQRLGIDYSLIVAKCLGIPKQEAFARHRRLRSLGLLNRVDASMVRYREGIVDNKWIKHRNHTYYDLTDKGRRYLQHYLGSASAGL